MMKEGIMIRQAASFGAPGCVRVTIGTRDANDAFIKAWGKILSNFQFSICKWGCYPR